MQLASSLSRMVTVTGTDELPPLLPPLPFPSIFLRLPVYGDRHLIGVL
jgi:hypothetical protein